MLEKKEDKLENILRTYKKVALAFSADSWNSRTYAR